MPQTEPEWVPGHQLSFWPELKFARASQHAADLQSRLSVWSVGSTVRTRKVISADQHTVDVFIDMPTPAPLSEMALSLGDAVHNLRAALDAVVWELAHVDGKEPAKPRRVAFPICRTPSSWNTAVKESLESVPSVALERIKSVQPFMYPEADLTTLSALHDADIRDKHKAQLECRFTAQRIDLTTSTFRFVDETEIPDPPFAFELHNDGWLADGEKLLSFQSPARFEAARVPINIELEITVETDSGKQLLGQFLTSMFTQVRGTLDIVYRGIEGASAHNDRLSAGLTAESQPQDWPISEDVDWDVVADQPEQ